MIYLIFLFPLLKYNLKLYDLKSFERLDIWNTSLKAFLAKPFFGWGGGNFPIAFEFFKFPYFDGVSFYNHSTFHAHSELLDILVENGMSGLFFYLLFIKETLCSKADNDMKAVFIFFTLFSFFDIVLYLPLFRFIYFIFAALISSSNENLSFKLKNTVCIIISVLLIETSTFFVKNNNFKLSSEAYSSVISSKNYVRNAAVVEYSSYFNRYNAVFYFELGRFYFNTGNLNIAELYLKKAFDTEPLFKNALLMMAQIEFDKGNFKSGVYYFKKINPESAITPDNFYSSNILSLNREVYNNLFKKFKNRL
jgi:O-antigen ligase